MAVLTKPFTPAAYTHITDADYLPLPEDRDMDIENQQVINAEKFDTVDDEITVLTLEQFSLDAGDICLPDADEDMAALMKLISKAIFWRRYMATEDCTHHRANQQMQVGKMVIDAAEAFCEKHGYVLEGRS